MYAGHDVLADNALVQHDGILIVISLPRHVGHEQVLTQCQLAVCGRIAFGKDVALLHAVALVADGTEVDGHVLVGATELGNAIFLQRRLKAYEFLILSAVIKNADGGGINIVNHAIAFGSNHGAAVLTNLLLNTGTYDGSLGAQQGHGLAHHVRSHQRTVSIVVLQEGNQGSSDRGNLLRSNVHQINLRGRNNRIVVVPTAFHTRTDEGAIVVQRSITLTNNLTFLLLGCHVTNTVVTEIHLAILYHTIGSLDEAKVVNLCKYAKRADQTDVGTFRRLNGTKATIVGVVYVTHLETCTLTRQTARTQG